MPERDDFSATTKRAIALRAGHRCSLCGQPTVGPSEESPSAVTNIGVAAHICAASPNGKRYVAFMSPEERRHISNAIWMCSDHGALIDRDCVTYTIECLREMKRKHESACAESLRRASRESALSVDLIAFGPDIECTGELLGVDGAGWSLQVKHFVAGDFTSLMAFIDRFPNSPPGDRYVLVNALGDGRVLTKAPTLTRNADGYLVGCAVAPGFPRIEAQQLGSQWAVSPKTNDLFIENGQIARVSGLDALPQNVRSCLSMQRGESPFHPDYGARLAQYFDAFRGSPWLGQLLKLEVIRQAAVPYHDEVQNRQYTPLRCVERVRSIELLVEAPENNWLPVRVEFDVCGVGRWQYDLSICMPPAPTLERIKSRQKAFAALNAGVAATPEALESALWPSVSRR
jgi:hypothetical protein